MDTVLAQSCHRCSKRTAMHVTSMSLYLYRFTGQQSTRPNQMAVISSVEKTYDVEGTWFPGNTESKTIEVVDDVQTAVAQQC